MFDSVSAPSAHDVGKLTTADARSARHSLLLTFLVVVVIVVIVVVLQLFLFGRATVHLTLPSTCSNEPIFQQHQGTPHERSEVREKTRAPVSGFGVESNAIPTKETSQRTSPTCNASHFRLVQYRMTSHT